MKHTFRAAVNVLMICVVLLCGAPAGCMGDYEYEVVLSSDYLGEDISHIVTQYPLDAIFLAGSSTVIDCKAPDGSRVVYIEMASPRYYADKKQLLAGVGSNKSLVVLGSDVAQLLARDKIRSKLRQRASGTTHSRQIAIEDDQDVYEDIVLGKPAVSYVFTYDENNTVVMVERVRTAMYVLMDNV